MEKFLRAMRQFLPKACPKFVFPWGKLLFREFGVRMRKLVRIFVTTSINYGDKRGPEAAASLAFYSIFSLFPLLILIVTLASFIVEESTIKEMILKEIYNFLPFSQELIRTNIERALQRRSTIGILGLLTLSWTATNYFHILIKNINLAWDEASRRSFIRIRLYAFAAVGILGALILFSLFATTIMNVISRYQIPIKGNIAIYGTFLWHLVSKTAPFLIRFYIIWLLYIWVPATKVNRSAGFWGALFATACWEVFTYIFTWVLGSGLTRYELIYGSLATLLTLYLWIYQSSFFILYGAHLSAAVAVELSKD